MSPDKKKRSLLVNIILALGLFTAGNATPTVFAIDHDGQPPKLDVNQSYLQRAFRSMQDLDLYRVALKFDRPVSLKGSVTLHKDGETITETMDEPNDYATFWLVYFSPGNDIRWKSVVDAIESFDLTATSIGGELAEFRK